MKTREFINKHFGQETSEEIKFGSIIKDCNGDMYSYGYHYPLIFTVQGLNFRNVHGYSNTTAAHIAWTRDIEALDIDLPKTRESYNYSTSLREFQTLESIANVYRDQIHAKNLELQAKKRKDTNIYKWLENELKQLQDNYNKVCEFEYSKGFPQ